MILLSFINKVTDLIILWMLIRVCQPAEDVKHPLAMIIVASAAPFTARLYPLIIDAATMFAYVEQNEKQKRFESIMLCTLLITIFYSSVLMVDGIIRAFRNGSPMSRAQIKNRTLIPFTFGLIFSILFYNDFMSNSTTFRLSSIVYYRNFPLLVVFMIPPLALLSLLFVGMKHTGDCTEFQSKCTSQLHSIRNFLLAASIPYGFLLYMMMPKMDTFYVMLSDFESFIRLIFILAILILEPFAGRLRVRDRFYRTSNNEEVEKQTQPPADVAPPSYEIAKAEMSRPWSTGELSLDDVKVAKKPLTPVQEN